MCRTLCLPPQKNTPLRKSLNQPLTTKMQQRRGYLRHTKVHIWNSINSKRNTIINEKQKVYLEYDTQFRHALSSIHDNLAKFAHGQCLYSVASRREFCQVASETFVETSILNCFSTRRLRVINEISRNKVVVPK